MSRALIGTSLAMAIAIAFFALCMQVAARIGLQFPIPAEIMSTYYVAGPYARTGGMPMTMRRWGVAQGAFNLTPGDVTTQFRYWLAWQGNPRLELGPVNVKDDRTITVDVVTKDQNVLVQRFAVDRRTGLWRPEV